MAGKRGRPFKDAAERRTADLSIRLTVEERDTLDQTIGKRALVRMGTGRYLPGVGENTRKAWESNPIGNSRALGRIISPLHRPRCGTPSVSKMVALPWRGHGLAPWPSRTGPWPSSPRPTATASGGARNSSHGALRDCEINLQT